MIQGRTSLDLPIYDSSALALSKIPTAEVLHIGLQGIYTNAKGTGQNHVLDHIVTSVNVLVSIC